MIGYMLVGLVVGMVLGFVAGRVGVNRSRWEAARVLRFVWLESQNNVKKGSTAALMRIRKTVNAYLTEGKVPSVERSG